MNKNYLKDLLKLSFPIMAGQIGIMLIGIGDVLVASYHSPLSLASIGIAVNILNPLLLFGVGLMMGVSSFVSIQIGKKENLDCAFKSSLVYCLIASAVLMAMGYSLTSFIDLFGLVPEMVPYIKSYINIVIFSFPCVYLYQVCKEFLQAYEKVKLSNTVAIVGAIINVPLNYCLVFGKIGLPEMGFDGLAYSSCIMRVFMALVIIYPLRDRFKTSFIDFDFIKRLTRFSFPIASMIFFEVLGFCLFGVLAGKFGIIEAATNNLILNMASLTFMVPLSLSSAASVKIGNAFGKKSYTEIKGYSIATITCSVGFMVLTALAYMFFSTEIMALVSADIAIITLGATVLFVVAIFQVVDGLQVALGGILRGLEKTKESFLGIILGFWVIGIPLGIYLGFQLEYKLMGLWIGLALALGVVALILSIITLREFKKMDLNDEFN
jgi:MATE family multidrug resistance protein